MTIITRFAPSPTGFLHIGGARTALFNYLFAKHHGGQFLLRVEDTDKKRSTQEATDAILDGLQWLGLQWDDEPTYQSQREERHREIAQQLLDSGNAYRCYATPEELAALREEAQKNGQTFRYPGIWRDRDASEAPEGIAPAIRIKAPESGTITINDAVQGKVSVDASEIDDMVILRADRTPTYMLAVVVDDHDMGVTNIIRGDDHFTNSFRQQVIYDALGWNAPTSAHVPLIHGPDGAKLSKRHGALGVDTYREMGYLPEAICNYLLRLGWSHGDDEIISREQAIDWFDEKGLGKSPSRIDFDKMANLNAHYMKEADPKRLLTLLNEHLDYTKDHQPMLLNAIPATRERCKTLVELAEALRFYIARPEFDEKAKERLTDEAKSHIAAIAQALEEETAPTSESIGDLLHTYMEQQDLKMKDIGPPLRAALCGTLSSAGSIGDIIANLGKAESLERLRNLP